MSTVTAFYCFFSRLLGASEQNQKGSIFGFTMFRKRLLFRVLLAPDKSYDSAMRKRTYAISLYRRDLCIYGGSRGQKETLYGGTGFLAISGIVLFSLSFYHFGAAIVISSTIAVVACGIE